MKEAKFEQPWYSKADVAALLGCCPLTIHRQIKAGNLGHFRIGSKVMISRQNFEDFLRTCERKPREKRSRLTATTQRKTSLQQASNRNKRTAVTPTAVASTDEGINKDE